MKHITTILVIFLGMNSLLSQSLTSTKIGESSNLFSSLSSQRNQLSIIPNIGTQGGTIGFIFRQNVSNCGGSTSENGQYRYSLSSDGGMTWNTGSSTCYGLGPINPSYTQLSRYPSLALFNPLDSTATPDDLKLVYSGPVLTSFGGWDGAVLGLVDSITTNPSTIQEIYPYEGGNQYESYSLIEGLKGEFWNTAYGWDAGTIGPEIYLNRGIYDSTLNELLWTTITLNPDYYLGYDGDFHVGNGIKIAFSPDGMIGYAGILADLVGNQDSVLAPCFAKTIDGGLTWSNFEEIDLRYFEGLGLLDSLSSPTAGIRSTAFGNFDLTVDKYGHPHLFCVIGNGATISSPPSYNIWSTEPMLACDFTLDAFGDWNILKLGSQAFFGGVFGNPSSPGESVTLFPFYRLSRSEDGSLVFYSWTDTEASATNVGNNEPNLRGAALNVDSWQMTNIVDWTTTDPVWDERAITPQFSPIALDDDSCQFQVPTVLANYGPLGSSILSPTSYFYIQGISYDACSDFTEDLIFYNTCKDRPFASIIGNLAPTCGSTDGQAWVNVSGGIAPYTYTWSSGQSTDSIDNLAAGLYEVIVTDSVSCRDTLEVVVNNVGAPFVTVVQSNDVSCAGLADGSVSILVSGGQTPYSFLWSNGDTNQNPTGLAVGIYEVEVSDASGCSGFASVTISDQPTLNVTSLVTDVLCADSPTGSINLGVSGGTPSYSYVWSTGATTQDVSGLAGNMTYSVIVTDNNGCMDSSSFFVSAPSPFTSSFFAFPNSGCGAFVDGSILVSVSGGTLPLLYHWTGTNGYDSAGINFSFPQGLAADLYTLTITDVNGCMYQDSVALTSTSSVMSVSTQSNDASCNNSADGSITLAVSNGTAPYTYQWSDGSTQTSLNGIGPGMYGCLILDAAGCTQYYSQTIGVNTTFSYGEVLIPPSCYGFQDGSILLQGLDSSFTIQWLNGPADSLYNGIGEGIYTATIADSSGCSQLDTFQLSQPDSFFIAVTGVDILCFGDQTGSVDVQGSGGTIPYAYDWSNGSNSSFVDSLGIGSYTVTVLDNNGCTSTDSISLTEPPLLEFSADITQNACADDTAGVVMLSTVGGAGGYNIGWNGSPLTPNPVGATTRSNLPAGTYFAVVMDGNGCLDTVTAVLTDPDSLFLSLLATPDDGSSTGTAIAIPDGGLPPYSYLWSDGSTDSVNTGLPEGIYVLSMTDSLGCMIKDSIEVELFVSIDDLPRGIQTFDVYPNPTSQQFYVDMELEKAMKVEFNLYDLAGKLVYHHEEADVSHRYHVPIQTEGLAEGTYLLLAKSELGRVMRRVLILR